MMLALEATTHVVDRSVAKLQQHPPHQQQSAMDRTHQRWAMRRWSLHGTEDTQSKANKARDTSLTSVPTPPSASSLLSPPPPPPPANDNDKEKRKRSRSVDLSPLQSTLKKAPAALTAKLTQCVEAMGLKDALHRYKSHHGHKKTADTAAADQRDDDACSQHHIAHQCKGRHVHFPSNTKQLRQVYDRPETTAEEKKNCHYTRHELMDMVLEAKGSLARELRFCSQPENTIFEQGYLTLPNELHFFHHKRYYCLLKARELLCYASPAHASKNHHLKCKIAILKVQECSTMSNQAKIAAFGAHLPATLPLMFFVTRADGERVLLAAESRNMKKSWVHTLLRLTQVQDVVLPRCVVPRQSSSSTCVSEEDSDFSSVSSSYSDGQGDEEEEEEKPEQPQVKTPPPKRPEMDGITSGVVLYTPTATCKDDCHEHNNVGVAVST